MVDKREQTTAPDESVRMGKFMIFGFWIIFLGLLTMAAHRWLERDNYLNRSLDTNLTDGKASVSLQSDRAGHYFATGTINGQEVRFLLDTGATGVSIPQKIADELGLVGQRPATVSTANGEITVQLVSIDQVGLGKLYRNDVRGSINPHVVYDEILLGMSFLRHFELVQRGQTLTIRQP